MKKIILLLSLLMGTFFAADAGNILYGPWIHDVSETGFTVIWIGKEPSLDYVEIAPEDGTSFETCYRPRYYESRFGKRVTGTFHRVRIDGLQPGTSYRYRIIGKVVKDDSNAYRSVYGAERRVFGRVPKGKPSYSIRTLDSRADTCRFSILNDIHFDDKRFTALASPINPAKTDFLVLNGDIASYSVSIDTVIKHIFAPIAEQAARIPLVFVRGNHEGRGRDAHKVYDLFPTSTGEFYYSFRQGPAAFIVLDGGEDKPDDSCEYSGLADYDNYRAQELAWLKKAVKDPSFTSAPIKICLIHVPTFPRKGAWYGEQWMAKNFMPLLAEAGIDVMLSAHYHDYIVREAGVDGVGYPIVVNSNTERMDVVVTASGIEINTYDQQGQLKHSWKK